MRTSLAAPHLPCFVRDAQTEGRESSLPAAMGHTSSSLALEVYARKMERNRDTGARMDALLRGADWAQAGTSEQVAVPFPGGENVLERQKAPR